jgi:hypothetical protein
MIITYILKIIKAMKMKSIFHRIYSNWISNIEFTKPKQLKYYNSFNKINQTKRIDNGNKEFHYKKRNVKDWPKYQNEPWEIDDDQPLIMDIIEEEENENPDLFNERKMTVNTKCVSKFFNVKLNFNPFNPNNNNNNNKDIIDKERNENNI